ncbi:DinB family protein [Lysinibacillus odysseyi]|uniref:DinB-like domain-containing protein n=1 Tax=Lysinibacillus odysseyi 34hs-1 = NBRC 100172 TaxID=1220589 RepID=A0A0A3IAN5_9BACI|nr:DinB family protein [Lysinibacillus odysseyi]KGR81801.1 hypothetical protein CD32_20960 [Lysinibacillus odysseyi 34hs-1 = NBRC 100172]
MEQKRHIVELYEQTINWVKELKEVSDEQWRMPVAPGKWTIAEVIGHLIFWDLFVLEKRLPFFFEKCILPASPNVDVTNRLASEESKIKTKEELIISFVATRTKLVSAIKKIPDENWNSQLSLKSKEITLMDYFAGLLDHDCRHFDEIRAALRKHGK